MEQEHLKLSRSSLRLFKECPKCFWLEKHEGIRRPAGYPQALANAVDLLLKSEFDEYRQKGKPHPLLKKYKIDCLLFPDINKLNSWRNTKEGLRFFDKNLNAYLFGAVDDVLQFPNGELAILDYKTTGAAQVNIYEEYQDQMNVYTFLLEKEGYRVSNKAYFAFFIADRLNGFGDRLPFRAEIHAINVNKEVVASEFEKAVSVARADSPPPHSLNCEYHVWHHRIKNF